MASCTWLARMPCHAGRAAFLAGVGVFLQQEVSLQGAASLMSILLLVFRVATPYPFQHTAQETPKTLSKEWKEATTEYAKEQKMDP